MVSRWEVMLWSGLEVWNEIGLIVWCNFVIVICEEGSCFLVFLNDIKVV